MSRGRWILVAVLGLVVLIVGGAAWYLGDVAPVATGYTAKTVCSGHLVSGRTVEDARGDLPPNPLAPLLRVAADDSGERVTASLLGAWSSTAYATEGLGCTLADEDPGFAPPDPVVLEDPDAPWPTGDAPAEAPADVDEEALDVAIEGAFAEDDPDGWARNTRAVVVVEEGELIAERYGEGFDADSRLLGWSMTKSVANAIVGRLVAAGELSLDDERLRPEWHGDERATITLEHLLRMTDGLEFDETYEPGTDATRMLFTPRDMGAYAADKPLAAEPGTVWSYSSGTTNVLCDLAHEATGAGPELARDLVFAPLGMASAVLEPDASGGLACSSFLYATARDWARFGQWFLQDGVWEGERLLPEDWVTLSTTPVEQAGTPYGAQWWLNAGPDGRRRMPSVPADAYWASGHEGQQVVVVPSEDLVVVRLGLSGDFDGIDWGLEALLEGVIAATR
jgi:CubicO group peptidase (beta-lactamase class C family)